jgi:2-amino-4-hydroxy-6-hydroxymethyldihydropteridine diphosphokinase
MLGSNIGDRSLHLKTAIELVDVRIGDVEEVSSVYETEPWGVEGHRSYFNQVVSVSTALAPGRLMLACLQIERTFGRRRYQGQTRPRKMDIDILFYDQRVVHQKKVTIPHPRLHLRRFALIPLSELNPELVHPGFQLSVRELLNICNDDTKVIRRE